MAYADSPNTDTKDLDEETKKELSTESGEARYWIAQLGSSKLEAAGWVSEARSAWREYMAEDDNNNYRQRYFFLCNNYQRYWSDTMTMLPVMYGGEPKPVAKRRFDNDLVANTASIILERFAAYLMEKGGFDRCMRMSALEYLHASKATARLFFSPVTIKRAKRIALSEELTIDEMGQEITTLVDDSGELPPAEAPVLVDEKGFPYIEDPSGAEEEITTPCIEIRPFHFDEIRISTGARNLSQVWWMAYLIRATKKEAKARFGDIVEEIQSSRQQSEPDTYATNISPENDALFSYWEIWDKRERKVYWIHELLPERPLDTQPDPYNLIDFYPSPPPMMVNDRYSDLYPVPDWTQTRDIYEALHLLAKRINRVVKASKGSAIYDGSAEGLDQLFSETSDGEGVAVSNWADLTNRGGIDGLVAYPDYARLSDTLQRLVEVFFKQKQDLDELRGISDIIRGTSDPATSATAEKIKQRTARNKFSLRIKEVDRFARDLIQSMCDLAFKTFEDDQIKEIAGYAYMDPEDQQRFDPALVMLRDDHSRLVRVDLETDVTDALNEQEAKENATEMLGAFGQFIIPMTQAVQQSPYLAPVAFKVLETAIGQFRMGKHAQDELRSSFAKMMEEFEQEPAPVPPAPDHEGMKLQLQQQKQQSDAQIEQLKLQQNAQFQQYEAQLRQFDLNLKQQKQMFESQLATAKLNLDARESDMIIREKMIEENRLAQQNVVIPQEEMRRRDLFPDSPTPSVVINVAQPQPEPMMAPEIPILY